MRRLFLAVALAGSFALIGSGADAASTGEANSAVAESERAQPCKKVVDRVERDIYFLHRISCRKAKRVMTRYILRKRLPHVWRCSDIGSIGKCINEDVKYYSDDGRRYPAFAFAPGSRA